MSKYVIRREQFPVTRSLVYLNHAACGPLSERVYRAMEMHAREQRDYGAYHWRDWLEEYTQFRQEAAELIGAKPPEIAILKNTSEGLSFVAEGWRWNAGENVVTTSFEFPSNYICWKRLERRGVEVREINAESYTVEDVAARIDEKTRIVAVSSASFHNGFAPDLEAIGELCRTRGVHLCVDAIQTLGAIALDVKKANVSFLAADSHKWLLGPEGSAIFYVSEDVRDQLEVLESGWLSVRRGGRMIGCGTELHHDARRFEAGTLNTNGIYGATAALELINEVSIERIEAEVLRLATLLADGLEKVGCRVSTPRPIRSGIVAAIPARTDSETYRRIVEQYAMPANHPDLVLHRWLEEQNIICSPREGMLRFSPHFYNSDEEIELVIDTLADVC